MKINLKITSVILLVILALIVIGVSKSFFSLEKKAMVSARRGMSWLLKYNGNFGDPGILWAVNEINKNYCRSSKLENFVLKRFIEFENHPIDSAYKKLITGSGGEKPDAETIKTSGKKYDNELLDALYCNGKQFGGGVALASADTPKTLENQGVSGYDLTHKFLSLIIAKNNNCANEGEINRRMDALASQIINEEDSSTFNDLFVERVALLEYAGYKMRVKREWIETIIKKQNDSGSWNNSALFGLSDDPHTTALATWALAQYSGTCPLI